MDAALNQHEMRPPRRYALIVTALAPVIPHILGSVFNVWYNMVIIDPLIRATGLRDRFISTVIVWNAVAYPIAVAIWLRLIFLVAPRIPAIAAW